MFDVRRVSSALGLSLVVLGSTPAREDGPPAVFAATRDAVAAGRTERTKAKGFGITRNPFDEVHAKGGLLVGFDLGLSPRFRSEVITAVRPVYRTAAGLSVGRDYGRFVLPATRKRGDRDKPLRVVELRARAGFAVGRVTLRTGVGIDAMQLHYHRIVGGTLEATASAVSEWVGTGKGGTVGEMTSQGNPVVGIHGSLDDAGNKVVSLGLVYAKSNVAPVAAKPPPPPIGRLPEDGPPALRADVPDPIFPPAPMPVGEAPKEPIEPADAAMANEPVAARRHLPAWMPLAVFAGVSGGIFLPLVLLLGRKKAPRVDSGRGAMGTPRAAMLAPSAETGVARECRPPAEDRTEPMDAPYFPAMICYALKPNRLHRIYVESGELLVVYAGPGNEWKVAGGNAAVGGLIPALIGAMLVRVAERKAGAHRAALDGATREDLDHLIHEGKGYRLAVADVAQARLEPATWWDVLNSRFGRLRIWHRTIGELAFQFETTAAMTESVDLLQHALGERFVVDVVLDPVQGRYVRRRRGL